MMSQQHRQQERPKPDRYQHPWKEEEEGETSAGEKGGGGDASDDKISGGSSCSNRLEFESPTSVVVGYDGGELAERSGPPNIPSSPMPQMPPSSSSSTDAGGGDGSLTPSSTRPARRPVKEMVNSINGQVLRNRLEGEEEQQRSPMRSPMRTTTGSTSNRAAVAAGGAGGGGKGEEFGRSGSGVPNGKNLLPAAAANGRNSHESSECPHPAFPYRQQQRQNTNGGKESVTTKADTSAATTTTKKENDGQSNDGCCHDDKENIPHPSLPSAPKRAGVPSSASSSADAQTKPQPAAAAAATVPGKCPRANLRRSLLRRSSSLTMGEQSFLQNLAAHGKDSDVERASTVLQDDHLFFDPFQDGGRGDNGGGEGGRQGFDTTTTTSPFKDKTMRDGASPATGNNKLPPPSPSLDGSHKQYYPTDEESTLHSSFGSSGSRRSLNNHHPRRRSSSTQASLWKAHESGISTNGTLGRSFLRRNHSQGRISLVGAAAAASSEVVKEEASGFGGGLPPPPPPLPPGGSIKSHSPSPAMLSIMRPDRLTSRRRSISAGSFTGAIRSQRDLILASSSSQQQPQLGNDEQEHLLVITTPVQRRKSLLGRRNSSRRLSASFDSTSSLINLVHDPCIDSGGYPDSSVAVETVILPPTASARKQQRLSVGGRPPSLRRRQSSLSSQGSNIPSGSVNTKQSLTMAGVLPPPPPPPPPPSSSSDVNGSRHVTPSILQDEESLLTFDGGSDAGQSAESSSDPRLLVQASTEDTDATGKTRHLKRSSNSSLLSADLQYAGVGGDNPFARCAADAGEYAAAALVGSRLFRNFMSQSPHILPKRGVLLGNKKGIASASSSSSAANKYQGDNIINGAAAMQKPILTKVRSTGFEIVESFGGEGRGSATAPRGRDNNNGGKIRVEAVKEEEEGWEDARTPQRRNVTSSASAFSDFDRHPSGAAAKTGVVPSSAHTQEDGRKVADTRRRKMEREAAEAAATAAAIAKSQWGTSLGPAFTSRGSGESTMAHRITPDRRSTHTDQQRYEQEQLRDPPSLNRPQQPPSRALSFGSLKRSFSSDDLVSGGGGAFQRQAFEGADLDQDMRSVASETDTMDYYLPVDQPPHHLPMVVSFDNQDVQHQQQHDDDDDQSWDLRTAEERSESAMAAAVAARQQFDSWQVLNDEHAMNYYYGGGFDVSDDPLPFHILGTNADDVECHPHVLSPPLMESLQNFLPPSVSEANFWMKFSLVRDGSSLVPLLQSVRGSTYTILAIETVDGEVFGSFTSIPWRINGSGYFGTGESFLWRMREPRTTPCQSILDQAQLESEIDVFPWRGENECVQICKANALALGGGRIWGSSGSEGRGRGDGGGDDAKFAADGGFGLWISPDLLHGTSSPCATFANPSLSKVVKDGQPFEIANLEAWALTPCLTVGEAEKLELMKLFLEENRN